MNGPHTLEQVKAAGRFAGHADGYVFDGRGALGETRRLYKRTDVLAFVEAMEVEGVA